jgi:polysaccharide biosynthesis protein PslH
MRVLWVSPRECWPPNSGAKLRDYHCAKALAREAQLTYVHFRQPGAQSPSSVDMPFCHNVISVAKPPGYTVAKLIGGLLGTWPLPVLNYYSKDMAALLLRLREEVDFDMVHFDSIHMAPYESLFRSSNKANTPTIYDWHNIESEAMNRYSREVNSVAKRLYARTTAWRLQKLETALLENSFGHIVCSKREEIELKNKVPGARVAVIPNGVDTTSFVQSDAILRWPPRTFIFVGAMNYYPNVDAVISFTRGVWPSLLSIYPGCRLILVGSDPVPSVLALRAVEGVEVTGTVHDVSRFYRDADVSLVPLRLGGGTRLKILEAMAAGVPVISTREGAEGLEVEPGRHIMIAEQGNPESWCRAISSLGESGRRREELTAAAMQFVRERYEWTAIGKQLCETYLEWFGSTA